MIEIITTITPIFMIIFLGALLRKKGFFPEAFAGPANHLVFYVAIPAMIFRVIARSALSHGFKLSLVGGTLIPVAVMAAAALLTARKLAMENRRRGTFAQISFHGNLGYIALAVAYYYLGEDGLARAGVLAGFLVVLQNVLAVVVLGTAGGGGDGGNRPGPGYWVRNLALHPVILSTLAGMFYSFSGLPMPTILDRALSILGGMALPMALLLIGASLSLGKLRGIGSAAAVGAVFKLALLPLLGVLLYRLFGASSGEYLPGLILLAAPTATVAYIMAQEMGGDPELASAAVSLSTLASAVTYVIWLGITA